MKPLRVLVLVHPDLMPPDSIKGYTEQEINKWKTEFDVVSTLRAAGHEVRPLGVQDELKPIRDEIEGWKPHVVFTLLEQFHGEVIYDQNVVSYLELMRIPYTGCNPRGLMLARGKDLSKTLVHYHRIPVPAFAVFPLNRKVKRPARLALPLIVKSLSEDGSWGISQASVVDSDEKFVERVAFIHEKIGTAAIAEQYIEGREIYVGVLGNERLRVLPVWELKFGNMPDSSYAIATEKVKHDPIYQKRHRHRGRPGQGPFAGTARPHTAHGETGLPDARDGWLWAHRLSPLGRRHAVFPGSEPQPRNRPEPGIRHRGQARRPRLPRPAAPDRRARHQPGQRAGVGVKPACSAPTADALLGMAPDMGQHARVVLVHDPARHWQPIEDRIEPQLDVTCAR